MLSLFSDWPPRRVLLVVLALLLPVAYLSFFYRLGSSPVLLWDESRLGLSALEMLNDGDWLVTKFMGQPDLWSPKPPLLIWIQAGLFWAFGANEITLRLPSALAALATTGLLAWFGVRVLKSPLTGLLSALVLLTTSGYVDYHITRNGDYDALLVFFTTWYCLSFYRYLEGSQRRYLWHTGLGIVLAVLTKSVAGLMFLPALLLYTILCGQLLALLRRREVYLLVAGVLSTVALYYGAREYVAPGYWKGVYDAELGGRLLQDLSHSGGTPWTWYLDQLLNDELLPWLYVFPLGFVALLHPAAPSSSRRLLLLLVLLAGSFIAIISSAATKYYWYEAPIYPFCALLAGAGLAFGAELLLRRLRDGLRPWVLLALLFGIFALPIKLIWDESFRPTPEPDLFFGRHIRHQAQAANPPYSYTLLSGILYNSSMEFYRLATLRNTWHEVRSLYPGQQHTLRPGETVVICNPTMQASFDSLYTATEVFVEAPCATLLITGRK